MRNPLAIALVCALAILSSLPVLDRQAEADYQSLFKRALVTFALARTLNGVISAVQGTELALQPAGVGVTLTPGEVLDPVNDLVERFSWIMLGATVSLGIQNVLLDVSRWWGTRLVVALLALGWLFVRWWRSDPASIADRVLLRAFWLALFIRLAVPLMLMANDAVYQLFLEDRYEASTRVVVSAGEDLEAMGSEAVEPAPRETQDGVLGSLGRMFDDTRAALDLGGRVERMQQRAGEVIEHLVELSVVFILQTGLLPIAFLWLLVQLAKGIWKLGLRSHRPP